MSTEIGLKSANVNPQSICSHSQRAAPSSVSSLPPEILIQVFHLVCNDQSSPCSIVAELYSWEENSRPFWKPPVTLSHVCSHWRQLAVNLPSIWSHIDLFPDSMLSARSHAYLARSKQTLLDIHIAVPIIGATTDRQDHSYNDCSVILPLIAIAAPRIKHFTIEANGRHLDLNFFGLVVATLFGNCIPNILMEVAINTSRIMYLGQHPIIRDHIQNGRLTNPTITALLFPITILRLEKCRLDLASEAYHGLTELRLIDCDMPNSFELTSIFQSSPQLRVLEITSFKEDVPCTLPPPVRLENLEVLILGSLYYEELDILELIAPGPKPLSLSIRWGISGWQFQDFVACSNITRLSTRGFEYHSQLAEVISLMPSIRVLAVYDSCNREPEDITSPSNTMLDSLYILSSPTLTHSDIKNLVKRYHARELILWRNNSGLHGLWEPGEGLISDNLYTICPMIKIVPDNDSNPIAEWY